MNEQKEENPVIAIIRAIFALIIIGISLVGMYIGYKVLLICLQILQVLG